MPFGLNVRHGRYDSAPSTSICELPNYEFVILLHRRSRDNSRMKILVIEDELRLAEYLRKALTENSYVVDVSHSGPAGLQLALHGGYDAVLLDVMLPGMDGFAIVHALRRQSAVPVLMLTAKDKVEDRVRGLQTGADDYLVKPFSLSELLARVQALLRRGTREPLGPDAHILRLADLEVDLARRRVTRGGERINLTAKEFTLLSLLLRRHGQVISRAALAEKVWDMSFDSNTNVVEVAVRRLRGKLDDPFYEKLLHTVRGMGYVLESRKS